MTHSSAARSCAIDRDCRTPELSSYNLNIIMLVAKLAYTDTESCKG